VDGRRRRAVKFSWLQYSGVIALLLLMVMMTQLVVQ